MPTPLPRIVFLVPRAGAPDGAGQPPANDNHERLPRAFSTLGWEVVAAHHDAVALAAGQVVAEKPDGAVALDGADAYFVLGFGARATFLDRMQLLRTLDQRRFVNTVDALIHQHGKASLPLACPEVAQPETHVSSNPARLAAVIARGGEWIAKPPAGSFGRDVFALRRGAPNLRAILEHLTRDGRYALVQERVGAADGGEKRVLVAAGEIVAAYGKRPVDHRANLDSGARAHRAVLTAVETATTLRLAARLDSLGVRFAAVDLAAAQVLEINVANPGGLRTCAAVDGVDPTPAAATALARWLRRRGERAMSRRARARDTALATRASRPHAGQKPAFPNAVGMDSSSPDA